jgi:hypothetical protein
MPGRLVFSTTADGGSSPTERMRIDSSGRVGIGTTAPSALLHLGVASAGVDGTKGVRITNPAGTVAMFECGVFSDSYIGTLSGSDFSIRTNNAPRISVTNAGNVGIGVTGAALKLHVEDSGSQVVRWTRTGVGAGSLDVDASGNAVVNAHTSSTGIAFHLQASEKARLDSSGRLLVGTSSVISNNYGGTAGLLQVAKNDYVPIGFFAYSNTGGETGYCPYVELNRARGTQATPTTVDNGDDLGLVNFYGHDGSTFIRAATIKSVVDGTPGVGDMPGRLVFSTTADGASSPTERARIDSQGFLRCSDTGSYAYGGTAHEINNSASNDIVRFFNSNASPYGIFVKYTGADPNNATNYVFGAEQNTGVNIYRIYSNGTVAARSDARWKTNIETSRNGYLEDLNQLRVVKYNWYNSEENAPKELGLIAQEVETVFPGLVVTDNQGEENESKSIKTSVLPFMLLKALQEATAKIETLEARLSALESA